MLTKHRRVPARRKQSRRAKTMSGLPNEPPSNNCSKKPLVIASGLAPMPRPKPPKRPKSSTPHKPESQN